MLKQTWQMTWPSRSVMGDGEVLQANSKGSWHAAAPLSLFATRDTGLESSRYTSSPYKTSFA